MTAARHVPVALDHVLELLEPVMATAADPVVVDMTLGLGGHTEAIVERFDDVVVIGIDRDRQALDRAGDRLAKWGSRVRFAHAVYDEIADVVADEGFETVSAVLFDLGVSSMQLDFAERGFAYAKDGPLDMRMNEADEVSAATIVNTWPEAELVRILRDYGEEKSARRIAKAIVAEREQTPFTTTRQLVDLLDRAIPAPARRTGGNPAKRTFQALRIAVNDELEVYSRALAAALDLVDVGGRVIVLSYHSLEDRITKRAFAEVTQSKAPRDLPVVPESMKPKFRQLTRGAQKASEEEIAANPRAKPVRVRAVERVAA